MLPRLCPESQVPALKRCVIVALHLGNNAMGDKGITVLADGLKHARGLQKLHLNDNEARSQVNACFVLLCCLLCHGLALMVFPDCSYLYPAWVRVCCTRSKV